MSLEHHLGAETSGIDICRSEKFTAVYRDLVQRLGSDNVERERKVALALFSKYDSDRSGCLQRHEVLPMKLD